MTGLRTLLAAALGAAALAGPSQGGEPARPRVVSLDYCADQYVLALADDEQILGISTGPDDAYSAMRSHAAGKPRIREAAEDVIALEPDLVVRSFGGGTRARTFYERLGIRVHDLGFAQSFDDIRQTVTATAQALGHPERGAALIAQMDAALLAAGEQTTEDRPAVLYVTPGGVTSGAGTLVHEILVAAGFENVAARGGASGWRDLPLEWLVLAPPELIVTGFFDMPMNRVDHWSPTNHPALREQLAETPTIHLDGAFLSCGAWFMADVALQARRRADRVLEERP